MAIWRLGKFYEFLQILPGFATMQLFFSLQFLTYFNAVSLEHFFFF